ncbi:MAG: selenocysteine-specific translation elongation factor [Carboxydocellales bacterium]
MKHIIVGTAGHVDHGKTTLVKALTGYDTDRLTEEKERGISIELGFAPLTLPSGVKVGLVDVPGHERFIKNMLAGVGGIDLVLLIIAADEGVMPQTREHLDIINLLQIPRGMVVLTKIDLVEPDWVELVQEEVREALKESVLATAPIVSVSAANGTGIPELLKLLEEEVVLAEEKKGAGPFRMPVDRAFSVTGFGTVVTGTLASGEIKLGDIASLLPAGLEAKVRSLQVHGDKVEQATAGQRVAINLAGLELHQIKRGDVVASPGLLEPAYRLDVELHLLPGAEKKIVNRQRMRLHLGTSEALCRVVLLDREELTPGETTMAQLLVEEQVVAAKRDRFVLRTYSPMHTVGGGMVIDPNPPRHRRLQQEVIIALATKLQGTPDELLLQQLIGLKEKLLTVQEVLGLANLSVPDGALAVEELVNQGLAVQFTGEQKHFLVATEVYTKWIEGVRHSLVEYHRLFPLRSGLSKEELRSRHFSAIPNKLFNHLLQHWEQAGIITVREQSVALAGFQQSLPGDLAVITDQIVNLYQQGWWQPPSWEEAVTKAALPLEWQEEVLYYLLNKGVLVKLADDLFMHLESLQAAKNKILGLLEEEGQISLAQVRDLLASSRKYILPMLEYFDRVKVTRRAGDLRVKF